ncbi:hypothetical protein LOD59_11365, partial [Xylella fastidiosa subsp. multiplex]|nr:hypothetical protein [Xylella fastidiosa subsp. multiplex]
AQLGLVGFFNHRIQGDGAYVAVDQGDHERIDGLRYNIRNKQTEVLSHVFRQQLFGRIHYC